MFLLYFRRKYCRTNLKKETNVVGRDYQCLSANFKRIVDFIVQLLKIFRECASSMLVYSTYRKCSI